VTPKTAGTHRSRQIHYLLFALAMKLDDDLLLENVPLERCNYQMALYAMHLATGSNLRHRAIKASTINHYLASVAKFLGRFSDRNVRKQQDSFNISPCIKAVLDEIKRWEDMPKRREPFTPEMWNHIHTQMQPSITDDSIVAACHDWFTCGLFAGLRLSEWAQDDAHQHLDNPTPNYRGDPKAFCIEDFLFRGPGNVRMTSEQAADAKLDEIERVIITFRMQKNGQNGETRTFIRNEGKDLCFIRAAKNILHRFIRLVGWEKHTPLAVFKNDDENRVQFVCSSKLEQVMKAAAMVVYKLDPEKHGNILQTWSAHSLRVGACVILHSQGYSATQIQFLLRWRSYAFMDYLRNLATLSRQQNLAVNQAMDMPNFL
jgi:hypothetical protein